MKPKIISLAHQKGGVGKSTIALNLCAALNEAGSTAYIIDADVQGSLIDGYELALRSEAWEHVSVKRMPVSISDIMTSGANVVIIDTPPYLSVDLPSFFEISDVVIVPCKTSLFDIRAVRATLALLAETQKKNPKVKYGVILNMVVGNASSVNESIREIISGYEVKVFDTVLRNRIAYQKSAFGKGSVLSLDDEKAKDEIYALTNEIIDFINA